MNTFSFRCSLEFLGMQKRCAAPRHARGPAPSIPHFLRSSLRHPQRKLFILNHLSSVPKKKRALRFNMVFTRCQQVGSRCCCLWAQPGMRGGVGGVLGGMRGSGGTGGPAAPSGHRQVCSALWTAVFPGAHSCHSPVTAAVCPRMCWIDLFS